MRTLGITAGGAAVICSSAIAILLAIFQNQDKKVPEDLAAALIVIMAALASVAFLIFLYSGSRSLSPHVSKFRLRWPIYDSTPEPSPLQWLFDLEADHRESPASRFDIEDGMVSYSQVEQDPPRLRFQVECLNSNVHTLILANVTGKVRYDGVECINPVENQTGRSRYEHRHRATIRFAQVIEGKFLEDIKMNGYEWVLNKTDLSNVLVHVEVDGSPEDSGQIGLGHPRLEVQKS